MSIYIYTLGTPEEGVVKLKVNLKWCQGGAIAASLRSASHSHELAVSILNYWLIAGLNKTIHPNHVTRGPPSIAIAAAKVSQDLVAVVWLLWQASLIDDGLHDTMKSCRAIVREHIRDHQQVLFSVVPSGWWRKSVDQVICNLDEHVVLAGVHKQRCAWSCRTRLNRGRALARDTLFEALVAHRHGTSRAKWNSGATPNSDSNSKSKCINLQ